MDYSSQEAARPRLLWLQQQHARGPMGSGGRTRHPGPAAAAKPQNAAVGEGAHEKGSRYVRKVSRSTRQPSPAASLALKRHLPEEQRPGPKQFLSEEKMAARFNTLSLENDHLYSTNGFPPGLGGERRWEHWLPEQRLPPAGGSEDAEGSRVVLEGEFSMADCSPLSLGELGPPGASLLLPPLLQCLNPATELVLWAPPSSPVPNSVHSLRLPSWALTTPLPGAAPRDGAVMGERD
ncbi:host cell factor C1 regulator 1 [Carettochelys insculpta]|uniref:host cell factor C1 regulator 1 n=1 Tax=Carettochelys insculpta TaxID=44489 RepID=UPI003EB9E0A9